MLYLATRKPNRNDAELIAAGKKFRLQSRSRGHSVRGLRFLGGACLVKMLAQRVLGNDDVGQKR
jgi:hypothetical protein